MNHNKIIYKKNLQTQLLNELLIKLDSIHNALDKHNLNLAEILIEEYYEKISLKIIDKLITNTINEALEKRDKTLLNAAIEAEIERIRTFKVKKLREIIQS